MIQLSDKFAAEYFVASGALGFDGKGWPWEKPLVALGLIRPELFAVSIKTLTRHPRIGNLRWSHPWNCVRLIDGGAVNKIGLTNPGVDWWAQSVGPKLDFDRFPLIGSIFGEEEELVEMTKILNLFNFVAMEVNVSCPNADHASGTEKIIQAIRAVLEHSRHPVILKLSVEQDYLRIAEVLASSVKAVALNSVPWKMAFPNGEHTPLAKLEAKVGGGGGGVSGKPAQKLNWQAVLELATQRAIPVIAPGIIEFEDLAEVRKIGASAVSFGAIHLRTPWKPTAIVRKDMICRS